MGYYYKPGDRVRVVDSIKCGYKYFMRSGPEVYEAFQAVGYTYEDRKPIFGKTVTISGYYMNKYLIEELPDTVWTDEMFAGFAKPFLCKSLL